MALYANIETTVVLTVVPTIEDKKMSKNNSNQQNAHNQIGQLMTGLILPERVIVIGVVSKDWTNKLDINRETKMEEIVKYLLKHNVEIDKLVLACDCVKALRPIDQQPPMQVIKPVQGSETVTISTDETEKLIETLEDSLDEPMEQEKNRTLKDSSGNGFYWLTLGAAAIGAIAYGGYRVLTRTPSH